MAAESFESVKRDDVRKALMDFISISEIPNSEASELADELLMWLWTRGFKIVPLEQS